MKHWRNIALALALLIGSVASAFAQFDRGSISGTIKDEQGGVMPGVTVTVTNQQTRQTQSTVTDGTGFYTFPNLLPGQYDVLAELQGFKKRTGPASRWTRRASKPSTSRCRQAPSARKSR
jgi:hypothetical protein